MGRTERLHPRQAEIDRILLDNEGKGSYERVLRLLREAGIAPEELSPDGESVPTSAQVSKLRHNRRERLGRSAGRPRLAELTEQALALGEEVRQARNHLAELTTRLEAVQQLLIEESQHLGS